MVADLIEPAQRASAYALLRMIANLGMAVGPAIGGFIVSASYTLAFILGDLAQILFAVLVLLRARETRLSTPGDPRSFLRGEGYEIVLRDRPFLAFCGLYTLAGMAYALIMVLLPVSVKENYGVPERLYGFIMTTNTARGWGCRVGSPAWRAASGGRLAVLRPGGGQRGPGAELPHVSVQHGAAHPGGDVDDPHGHHPDGEPGPSDRAGPVYECIWAHMGDRLWGGSGDRRAVA